MAGHGPLPWIKRIFHFYTENGLSRAQSLPVDTPTSGDTAQLLRRTAIRVTIGSASAGAGYDFHVANYPTLLMPIFGSTVFGLHEGSQLELKHGDLGIAEDCTGQGHVSYAGKDGCVMIFVQLPKDLCPVAGGSDMSKFWTD